MSSAPPTAAQDLARIPQAGHLGPALLRDLGAIVVAVILSLAAGVVINRLSSQPLPMVYQTPEQRLDAELTALVKVPAFQLAPAATLGLAEFRSAVQNKSAVILDARPAAFFAQGHVPGALNLARDNFAKDYHRLSTVLKPAEDKPLIVYCSGGECHDSRLVANALLSLGFSNVRVFTGGWEAWSAAELPISKGAAQ
jgi:rhodanese-related sulfurtransferase